MALELLTNGRQMDKAQLMETLASECVEEDAIPHLIKLLSQSHYAEFGENLIGMGIGVKNEVGNPDDETCIKFYVREKRPVTEIDSAVPEHLELPGLGVFLTDVEEIGKLVLDTLNGRVRPALGGYSIGHSAVKGGSVGCLVSDRNEPDQVFVLSNSHVLAKSGTAKLGDSVLQPSSRDGGTAKDMIANLAKWVPFDFSAMFVNKVDAAIAGPVTNAEFLSEIALLNLRPAGLRSSVQIGTRIQKVGRTTRHTFGTVKDIDFRTEIAYPKPGGGIGRARFTDQVLCTRYSASGDSGALVLDEEGLAVGLHVGGTRRRLMPWRSTSFFSPISFVLDELDVDLVTTPF